MQSSAASFQRRSSMSEPGFRYASPRLHYNKSLYLTTEFYPTNSSVGILNNRKAPDITLANNGAATAAA